MTTTAYPGIKKIFRFPKSHLPSLLRHKYSWDTPCVIPSTAIEVEFYGMPTLTETTKLKNGKYISESKLAFNTTERVIPDNSEAWGVRLVDGSCYVVTAFEPPAPEIQISSDTSSPGGSPRGSSVQIAYNGAPVKAIIR